MVIKFDEIIKKYDLKLLLLFGSQARGDARKNSDTDIAVYGDKRIDLEKKARMMLDLAPILKTEKIDVVDLREASTIFLYKIMQDAKFLCGDMMIFYEFRVSAFKKYVELKYFRNKHGLPFNDQLTN